MRVAFVHDWLTVYAGAERLLEQMLEVYPDADLFSLIDFLPEKYRGCIRHKTPQTSFLQKLPFAKKKYRSYLPLMPLAIEQFDLSSYDLVISNSYAVAKGVITGPNQKHICMCCSPMRYAWDLQHQYLRESGMDRGIKGWIARSILHKMRMWDVRTTNGVDSFIAISEFISKRIWKTYRREATVIYPPVDVESFPLHTQKEDFFLAASRLVPYKKIDLIVEAFQNLPDQKLVVVGDGPEMPKIKAKAGKNVEIMGYQPHDTMKSLMQRAKGFIFAAEEDFGIVSLEAQACGTPVIAYGRGGSLETVVEGTTGLFFYEQSVPALSAAIQDFDSAKFDPHKIREHAERFGKARFREEFREFVEKQLENVYIG